MAKNPQPAKKSYFFGKGYVDLFNTIKGAWKRNFLSVLQYKDAIGAHSIDADGKIKYFFLLILHILAMISVLICGSIITAIVGLANIAILIVVMAIIYIGFTVIWLVDRIYLERKKIFTACPHCKCKSLIPTYLCPQCGVAHTNLTPSVYGIWRRTCTGRDGRSCGASLPTNFMNGRKELKAVCAECGHALYDHESVPICIPVVGGRSVGKTAFITAFSKSFFDEVAPAYDLETHFYNSEKEDIFHMIERDYASGSTRMTERPQDINMASSVSFSFFVKNPQLSPERLIHVYDIAGEVFTDSSENEVQKQYEYCQGMVLMVDPFSIPAVRNVLEDQLSPEDVAGIGRADINEIVDSFLNKLREVTGLSDQKMTSVPLAVVISKIDSADLESKLGDTAIRRLMNEKPDVFKDYFDTQDYLCRKFLSDNGMSNFLNSIKMRFSDNRFFACSAIGHTRDHGKYNPQGVLPPMQWLVGKADPKMGAIWNDISFSKKVYAEGIEAK